VPVITGEDKTVVEAVTGGHPVASETVTVYVPATVGVIDEVIAPLFDGPDQRYVKGPCPPLGVAVIAGLFEHKTGFDGVIVTPNVGTMEAMTVAQ
jgi:hypothetical protein